MIGGAIVHAKSCSVSVGQHEQEEHRSHEERDEDVREHAGVQQYSVLGVGATPPDARSLRAGTLCAGTLCFGLDVAHARLLGFGMGT